MLNKKILVTGASGNLGREVVQALLAKGFAVKAATRDPARIPSAEGVDALWLDYDDPATADAALADVGGLFLVAPPMDPTAPDKLNPVIDKAKVIGVEKVVLISALGVDQAEGAPLRTVELHLMQSGLPSTILRPNFFMENFSAGFLAPTIRQQRGVFLAAADGKTSFISTRDIAAVAAACFADDHAGQAYNLTGPEALDHTEAARAIGEALGEEVTYHALSEEAMLQGARDAGMPEPAVQYLAGLYQAVRAGYCAVVTDDVQRITGQMPMSFREFAEAHRACWQ